LFTHTRRLRRGTTASQLIESGAQPFQTCNEHFGLATNAYSKMLRHLEKSSWNDCGFIFLPKQGAKSLDACVFEPRKADRAKVRSENFEIGAGIKKAIEVRAIRLE